MSKYAWGLPKRMLKPQAHTRPYELYAARRAGDGLALPGIGLSDGMLEPAQIYALGNGGGRGEPLPLPTG